MVLNYLYTIKALKKDLHLKMNIFPDIIVNGQNAILWVWLF